jgi:hypothetical protein
MHIAAGLVWGLFGSIGAAGRDVANPFAKAAPAELLGATKKIDGVIRTVRSDTTFHGAEMFVTKGENVRPHDCGECSIHEATTKSEYGVSLSAGKSIYIGHQPAIGSASSHSAS